MAKKKLKLWVILCGALSLIVALYFGYEISLRVPTFSIALAEIQLEGPIHSVIMTEKYQAAYNLSRGVSVEQSEKWLGIKLDAEEIANIEANVKHRQLKDTSVLIGKGVVAWLVVTFLILFFGWIVSSIVRKSRLNPNA